VIKSKPYFEFKGIASYDMGIIVTKLSDIIKPQKRVTPITIPGRQGVLYQDDGTYSNYTYDIECAIVNQGKAINYSKITNWLDGYGELIVSTEPDKIYRARIINQIPISGVLKNFSNFLVQFDCFPFKYSVNAIRSHADDLTLTAPTSIKNKGTVYAEPTITVYGSGNITLTINGANYTLTGVDGYITVDSERMEVYKGAINANNKYAAMDFPRFEVGMNTISWAGNVTKVEIKPKWRWL